MLSSSWDETWTLMGQKRSRNKRNKNTPPIICYWLWSMGGSQCIALGQVQCSVWCVISHRLSHKPPPERGAVYYRVIKWSRHHYVKWIVLFVSVTSSSSFSVNWFVNRWETMTFDKSHVCPLLNWYWRWHWKVLSYHAFMQIGDYRNITNNHCFDNGLIEDLSMCSLNPK